MEKNKTTKKVRYWKNVSLYDLPLLLAEESVPTNLQVPESLRIVINDFKKAYHERYGILIDGGIKTIAILMLAHGSKGLKEEADKLREEAKIPI